MEKSILPKLSGFGLVQGERAVEDVFEDSYTVLFLASIAIVSYPS
jgi:hypothetical protein